MSELERCLYALQANSPIAIVMATLQLVSAMLIAFLWREVRKGNGR